LKFAENATSTMEIMVLFGVLQQQKINRVTIIFSFFKIILEVSILDLRVQIYFLKYDYVQTGNIITM